ncbi:helix-turn-helix domain-containing protein [Phreatobacter stygius]|uniref:Helix-turn-helix domain-containing protein n=1 Tax=Phreatobacter stygius TaxID=1940610 RepID=A0A4D7AZ02_9HYPH|nr:helix-turn-helix domain-containing protein [Phreatobacter stygius]QCI62920.1 helix-turn-helix domain-containing protein [Phreatobacter stygius]
MPVRVTLDAVLGARGLTAKVVAERIRISETQLSLFRSGKVRGIRFSTLSKLCLVLDCELADLLRYDRDAGDLLAIDDDKD